MEGGTKRLACDVVLLSLRVIITQPYDVDGSRSSTALISEEGEHVSSKYRGRGFGRAEDGTQEMAERIETAALEEIQHQNGSVGL